MPKFEKPSPALVDRFNAVLDRVASPDVGRRPMFGHPCAWVGGNISTGLFAQHWWVRLSPGRTKALLDAGEAATLEVMPGRPMQGYVVMPAGVVADDRQVQAWVTEALDYTASMPAKTAKKSKSARQG